MDTILVIFPGALGDFVCFIPALTELARHREADLFARTQYGDLLPSNISARSLERYEISRLFVAGADKDKALRRFFRRYSAVYSWMGSGQRDFVSQLQILTEGKLRIFPFRPAGSRVPMADYFLSCLGTQGPRGSSPHIPLKSEALAWTEGFWWRNELRGKRVLALCPGSGAREKNWPEGFYLEAAHWWKKEAGREVLVILGPVEEERGQSGTHWHGARVVRGLTLAQLAALISRCDLYLGNDSGVTHLAAALGVATVALFGPTDPAQWSPSGKNVTLVTRGAKCSPCATEVTKSCPHRKCLTTLKPDYVARCLEKLLATAPPSATLLDKVGGRDYS